MKLAETFQKGRKHWKKEKLLVTSNFFFSHSVFERTLLQTCENQGLFGKGLKSIFVRIENIVGKEGNTDYQQFQVYTYLWEMEPLDYPGSAVRVKLVEVLGMEKVPWAAPCSWLEEAELVEEAGLVKQAL